MLHLIHCGLGRVGSQLTRYIIENNAKARQNQKPFRYLALANSKGVFSQPNGFDDQTLEHSLQSGLPLSTTLSESSASQQSLKDYLEKTEFPLNTVLIDASGSSDMVEIYQLALKRGISVVTANKRPLGEDQSTFDQLFQTAKENNAKLLHETTVGAGLPIVNTIRDLVQTGDQIERIQGCFSGTLGFICSELDQGNQFSKALKKADQQGFTEPDPRDDLSGQDVGWKTLILARLSGQKLNLPDFPIQPLYSPELGQVDRAAFLERLPELNPEFSSKVGAAQQNNQVLRYVAEITPENVRVGLQAVPQDSPLGRLQGPDNIAVIQTKRYHDQPLVIQGPGAGLEVTAAGLLAELYHLV